MTVCNMVFTERMEIMIDVTKEKLQLRPKQPIFQFAMKGFNLNTLPQI